MSLLTIANVKTLKGQHLGYYTMILHLAPARLSGWNVCPMASAGCAAACLNTAGRGKFDTTQAARLERTRFFFEDRAGFMLALAGEIAAGVRTAARLKLTPAVRLNGTSDIRWETIPAGGASSVFELFPQVQFYDYTKLPNRRELPDNYRLTFSRSETNDDELAGVLKTGHNVAIVFDTGVTDALPKSWAIGRRRVRVIDGDTHDLRFLDPRGVVVGLRAKGAAKRDASGFVVRTADAVPTHTTN